MGCERARLIQLSLALYLIVSGAYIFTYSGLPESPDEFILFDSTQSFVLHGTMVRTIGFNIAPTIQKDGDPFPPQKYEPLQILAAAPLFWLGHHLRDIGRMHAVFTLNLLVTTLTALSLFYIAVQRGYSWRVAWWGVLIFAFATAAWPYSRWLFREPLMGFFVLWAFHLATSIPKRLIAEQPVWGQAILTAITLTGAILTKQVGWLLLPTIALCLIPPRFALQRAIPVLSMIGAIFVVLIVGVMVLQPDVEEGRYSFSHWTNPDNIAWNFTLESLLGYQVSPARSLWLYSPILLAGWFGAAILIRQQEWRLVLGPALAMLMMSASYGATRQVAWDGGWGWGPRYMLPFVPVLMLWVLPVIERLFEKNAVPARPKQIIFGVLALLSVGMQLLGLGVPYSKYYTQLEFSNPQHLGLTWADHNWVWRESPISYHFEHFDSQQIHSAWKVVDADWLVPLLTLLMVSMGLVISYRHLRFKQQPSRQVPILNFAAVLFPLIPISIGLYQLRDDERYIVEQADVREIIEILNDEVKPGDVVLIENGNYSRLFMNYFKADCLLITLPQPLRGGYASDEPAIRDDELYAALGPFSSYAIGWVSERYERIWLVASSGPSATNAIRPAERLLTIQHFPVLEYTKSDKARAILFDTRDAPSGPPTHSSGLMFGSDISLIGYDLPAGNTFKSGEIVPISFLWAPLQPIIVDYQISVRLADEAGLPIVQWDGLPQATFGYTSTWQTGQAYRDNHGLLLPDNFPAGEYQLEVIIYNGATNERLAVSNPDWEIIGEVAILSPIIVEGSHD